MRKFTYEYYNGKFYFREIFLNKSLNTKLKFYNKFNMTFIKNKFNATFIKNKFNATFIKNKLRNFKILYYHKKIDLLQKFYDWQIQKIHNKLIKYRKIIERPDVTIKMSEIIL